MLARIRRESITTWTDFNVCSGMYSSLLAILSNCSKQSYSDYMNQLNPYLRNNTGFKRTKRSTTDCNYTMPSGETLPTRLDYSKYSKVSPVKNQGRCGSCYLFAAIGTLESQYLLHTETKGIQFSEQALLNCLNNGCRGGWMNWAWDYILIHGIPKSSKIPYLGAVSSMLCIDLGLLISIYISRYNLVANILLTE